MAELQIIYTIEFRDGKGKPIVGGLVETSWNKVTILQALTDARGRVQFRVPDGVCLLYIRFEGVQIVHFRNVYEGQVDTYVITRTKS